MLKSTHSKIHKNASMRYWNGNTAHLPLSVPSLSFPFYLFSHGGGGREKCVFDNSKITQCDCVAV